MSVNADDLPTAERQQLGLPSKGRTRKAPSRAGTGLSDSGPGTCKCGDRFPTAKAWENHAKVSGCTRWAIDIPEQTR